MNEDNRAGGLRDERSSISGYVRQVETPNAVPPQVRFIGHAGEAAPIGANAPDGVWTIAIRIEVERFLIGRPLHAPILDGVIRQAPQTAAVGVGDEQILVRADAGGEPDRLAVGGRLKRHALSR